MIQQVAEKRPSTSMSGRLTLSAAWQEVAPYSSRRRPQDCLPERQVKGLREHCICAFLSSLRNNYFFSNC